MDSNLFYRARHERNRKEREERRGRGEKNTRGREKERERERDEEESIRGKKSIATCLLARWTQSNLSMYKHDRSIKMGSSRSRAFCSVSITVETDRGHPFHRRQMEQVRRDPHNEKCHGIKRASIGEAFPVPAPGKKTRSNRGRILRKIIPREKKRRKMEKKRTTIKIRWESAKFLKKGKGKKGGRFR